MLYTTFSERLLLLSLALAICAACAVVTRVVDRRLAVRDALTHAANHAEANFRMLAGSIPQIIWTGLPNGEMDYCNHHFYELTGAVEGSNIRAEFRKALHPDDLPLAISAWQSARSSGKAFDMEYRLKSRDGDYRWHLVRATPMRDSSGTVVKWFGSCTDIQDQMHTQQQLEEQIKQHTAALFEANSRLQEEMHERALAQQELNQQNERMLGELTERSERATTLAKMAELLQSCAGLRDVFSVVAGMAPKVFHELRGAVWLFNSSRKMLEVAVAWSGCEVPVPVFEPQDCWALRTGHVHFVALDDHTAECMHAESGKYSYLCLPLQSQGEAIGVLHFQMNTPGELAESEKLLATTFAEQVGLSIANIRLREALRNQSIRDPLTTLYNRRYLEEMMERETRRAVRAAHGLGVLMLDLDHFKTFNDTYGHDAGDTVLRHTASLLSKSVRAEDIVCRFGGEEFVVVLPMADLKASSARAERVCARLRELTVQHQGQALGIVTASIGVAALPEHGTTPKELLEAADAALYRAKRGGRDRVEVAVAPAEAQIRASGTGI